ncbi:unnamed protein product [Urochloa decumbens]|uniref:DUF1618 domain-containing protein n=1 Tax=Urochloa decumbens TaxID=240449 RepID=A0ABC9GTU3_9POAL
MRWIEELLRTLTMSSTDGSAASKETKPSWSRRPRTGSRRPSHVLLNVEAVVGTHQNRTTAVTFNRNEALIQVSFVLKPPPQPSIVYVASDDLNPFVGPVVLFSVDDLLLLRVNIGRKEGHLHLKHNHDYYVYRSAAVCPSLHLLASPSDRVFHRDDVGLLRRPPDGRYVVAALMDIGRNDVYELQLYHSEMRTWTTRKVPVQPPQWDPLPKNIPVHCGVLLRHYTSAVVAIGGEGGTMAWVDLWRSILLCDVLLPNPSLRGVPIPLPSRQMSLNDGLGVKLDFAPHSRGISFNRDKGCLMLVHLEQHESPPFIHAATRGLHGEIQVHDWEVTTWSNTKMSDSLEDWHEERTVQASNITIDARMLMKGSDRLPCRVPSPQDHSNDEAIASAAAAQAQQLDLHNLSVCQPTLCPNGEDSVVYLVAREKYLHPKAWFLAVDMKNQGTLKHVAYIGNQDHLFCHRIYCLSRISKYTNPKMRLLKSSTTDDLGN